MAAAAIHLLTGLNGTTFALVFSERVF